MYYVLFEKQASEQRVCMFSYLKVSSLLESNPYYESPSYAILLPCRNAFRAALFKNLLQSHV